MSTLSRSSSGFGIADYIVFSLFMMISISVGVFFSVFGGRQRTTSEYNTGNREMGPIPVGVSIAVSFISAMTIVAIPAEIYVNGYMFAFAFLGQALSYLPMCLLFAQLFHPTGVASPNEYLQIRFKSKVVGLLAYSMSTLSTCLYMGLCMYAPAMALSEVTGGRIPVVAAFLLGNAIGILYTTIGGIKAVVWTDVIQAGFMFASLVAVTVKAVMDSGGPSSVVDYSYLYGRLHPVETSPDPRVRHTVWGTMISGIAIYGTLAVSPANVQRLASIRSLRSARLAYCLAGPMFLLFSLIAVVTGLAIFAYYAHRGCDVFAANWLSSGNTVVPYYVIDQMRFPGFPGFMMAGIFASSLSTQSSSLSAMGVTVWRDVMKPYCCATLSEGRAAFLVKIMVASFGLLSTLLGYVAMQTGSLIMQTLMSLEGAIRGPSFALFLLGAVLPCANAYGAVIGAVAGLAVCMYLNVVNIMAGSFNSQLPTITTNCSYVNFTLAASADATTPVYNGTMDSSNDSHKGNISYVWIMPIGFLVSFILGVIVSLLTRSKSPTPDPKFMWKCCRPKSRGGCCSGTVAGCDDEKEEPLPAEEEETKETNVITSFL